MFIAIFIFLICLLVFITIQFYRVTYRQTASFNARLERIKRNANPIEPSKERSETTDQLTHYLHKTIRDFSTIGIDISIRELLTLNGIAYLTLFLILFLFNKNFLASALVGSVGLLAPGLFVRSIINRRHKAFERLFGDAMTLIGNTLRAGFSLKQALQLVANEMPSPIKDEFKILNHELDWGLSLEDAMRNLGKRVDNEHVNLFVTAILIQSSVGGSLAEIVNKIAETITTKQQIMGEVNVLTAQGKVSGFIIGIMPIGIGLMIGAVNPEYMSALFTNPLGIVLLGVASVMEIIGIFCIKALINLEQ